MTREEYNRLSKIILDACITVHREMGPGLLESVYELCLMIPVYEAQLISYLKLADKRLGFLINFNVPLTTVPL